MYSCIRQIYFGKSRTSGGSYVQGIIAGCSFKTTALKIFFIETIDDFTVRFVWVGIKLYIDDLSLRWQGYQLQYVNEFLQALEHLMVAVETGMFLMFNNVKNRAIASSAKLEDYVKSPLRDLNIYTTKVANLLGVDVSNGRVVVDMQERFGGGLLSFCVENPV